MNFEEVGTFWGGAGAFGGGETLAGNAAGGAGDGAGADGTGGGAGWAGGLGALEAFRRRFIGGMGGGVEAVAWRHE